jgi:hypothetical protein
MNGDHMTLIGRNSELDRIRSVIRTSKESALSIVVRRGVERSSIGLRSPWLVTALARSRAVLADGEEPSRQFSLALGGRSAHDSLLEGVRTLLCYAERLGALGRLREGREGLLPAKVLFDVAGADAWTQRVDSLLLDERMGPARVPANPAMLMFGDYEHTLAQMVGCGVRNKEMAPTRERYVLPLL